MLWNRRKTPLPTEPKPQAPLAPYSYPSGIAVAVGEDFYYVKGGVLFRFVSERAMDSWMVPLALANPINISEYSIGGTIGFRDGTLIENIADGKMYLVSGSRRRRITDPDVLGILGLRLEDAMLVSEKEANSHQNGEDL